MKRHTKIYLDHFHLTTADPVVCEVFGAIDNDIHHIESRGMCGSREKDVIENLMAVCRECHERYGDKKQHVTFLQEIHNGNL